LNAASSPALQLKFQPWRSRLLLVGLIAWFIVLVARALWKGRVADPAQRDGTVADYRALLATISESTAVQASLIVAGDGLLQLVKLSD